MSTRSTLAYGPGFHLYHEVFDEDYVYLQVEGTQFEAGYGRVMVPIPVHVWEVIRRHPGVDLGLADQTDDELRRHVEQTLDERLRWHQQAPEEAKPIAALAGALVFGSIDDPREVQLAKGLEDYIRRREHQRQIQQAIAELARTNLKR